MPRRPHVTAEAVRPLVADGLSDPEIAARLGVRTLCVYRCRQKHGIAPAVRLRVESLAESIRLLHAAGMTDRQMATALRIDKRAVFWRRTQLGLPSNQPPPPALRRTKTAAP